MVTSTTSDETEGLIRDAHYGAVTPQAECLDVATLNGHTRTMTTTTATSTSTGGFRYRMPWESERGNVEETTKNSRRVIAALFLTVIGLSIGMGMTWSKNIRQARWDKQLKQGNTVLLSPKNNNNNASSTATAGAGGGASSAGTTTVPVMYRPVCQNYGHATGWTIQTLLQTSMKEPSQQWASIACLDVVSDDETTTRTSLKDSLFFHTQQQQQKSSELLQQEKNAAARQAAISNQFGAADAVLQVNFSHSPFANRPPILGFGGAFTEASALNFQRLSAAGQAAVMELLFGKTGLGYALGRVHINSCDFSVASYNFDNVEDDFDLKHFDMGVHHDIETGMVHMALRATSVLREAWATNTAAASSSSSWTNHSDGELLIYASPWSPPPWMKAPTPSDSSHALHAENMTGSAVPCCLRDGPGPNSTYAAAWALYFSKFLTAYEQLGLPFWGVTVQNEPEFPAPWEACSFNAQAQADFIRYHLGPVLRRHHPKTKLLVFDHNKDHVNAWIETLFDPVNGTGGEFIDGTAIHWYAGGMDRLLDGALGIPNLHRLQDTLRNVSSAPDNHLIIGSEACHCPTTGYAGGDIENYWSRAERYAHTILADLMAGSNGWLEWNLILDSIGGPNHLGNLCEATLLAAPHRATNVGHEIPVLPEFEKNRPFGNVNIGDGRTREELNALGFPAKYLDVGVVVQPLYYYMGHISRYVRPGSYAVMGIVQESVGAGDSKIFRPAGQVVAGGGQNDIAREGIEVTVWPCEGSTRQQFHYNYDTKLFEVFGHDWLGHPTTSCVGNEVDVDFRVLRLVDCKRPQQSNSSNNSNVVAGRFDVLPIPGDAYNRYTIVLKNRNRKKYKTMEPCVTIRELLNGGGANGPRGGAQVTLGNCTEESAKWRIDHGTGEVSSYYFGSNETTTANNSSSNNNNNEVCMTTGWPFLQMGAFVTPNGEAPQTVVILNEARDSANFVLKNENDVILAASIPPRSIQTFLLQQHKQS